MRRILILALCLLALCRAALGETYVAHYFGSEESMDYDLLIRDDGTPITAPETYGTIYEITPSGTPEAERLYSATPYAYLNGIDPALVTGDDYIIPNMALMDASGALLTGCDYAQLIYRSGYVIFTMPGEDGLTGAMDPRGNVILPPAYADLCPMGDGRWLALDRDGVCADGGPRYSLRSIDADGAVRDANLHVGTVFFEGASDGICPLWYVEEYEDKVVYVGPDGALLFGRSFDEGYGFENGHAIVSLGEGRRGIIDRDGAFAVPAEYDYITGYPDKGVYTAEKGTTIAVFDAGTCKERMRRDFGAAEYVSTDVINREWLVVYTDSDTFLCTLDGGDVMTIPQDTNIDLYLWYPETPARLVESFGDYPFSAAHLIDLEGNQVGPNFQSIGKGWWQDGRGRYVFGAQKLIQNADGSFEADWNSYRCGVIDQDGNILLPATYLYVDLLSIDRYWVTTPERTGLIDDQGNWLYAIEHYSELMD